MSHRSRLQAGSSHRGRLGSRARSLSITLALAASLSAGAAEAPRKASSLPTAVRTRIEHEAARLNDASDFAFFVVKDPASGAFVQFAADNAGGSLLDVPLVTASDEAHVPVRDSQCGITPVTAAPGEHERVQLAAKRAARLLDVLAREQAGARTIYCLLKDRDGLRHGYAKVVHATLTEPAAVANLVERLLRDAYGVADLGHLQFYTDSGADPAPP